MEELTEKLKILTFKIGQKTTDPDLTMAECYTLSEVYLLLLEASKKMQRSRENVPKN